MLPLDPIFFELTLSAVSFNVQLASLSRNVEFESFQLDATEKIQAKEKRLAEFREKLEKTPKNHRKYVTIEEKVQKITRRLRQMRAYYRSTALQERVQRQLNQLQDPIEVDWYNLSGFDEVLRVAVKQTKALYESVEVAVKQGETRLADAKTLVQEKIRRQYKRLAIKNHPDRFQGDKETPGYIEAVNLFQSLSQGAPLFSPWKPRRI